MTQTVKNIIIALVTVVLLGGGYYFFLYDPEQMQTQTQVQLSPEVQNTVALLNRAESITIDADFFQSEGFQLLQNYRLQIIDEPVGRENPFEPIGTP